MREAHMGALRLWAEECARLNRDSEQRMNATMARADAADNRVGALVAALGAEVRRSAAAEYELLAHILSAADLDAIEAGEITRVLSLTQQEYDPLEIVDPHTLYFIQPHREAAE